MMGMRTPIPYGDGREQELQKTRTVLMQAGQADQAQQVTAAIQAIQGGGDAEKTLMGTMLKPRSGQAIGRSRNEQLRSHAGDRRCRSADCRSHDGWFRAESMRACRCRAARMPTAPQMGGTTHLPRLQIHHTADGILLRRLRIPAHPRRPPKRSPYRRRKPPVAELVDLQDGRRFRLRMGVNTLGRQGTDILVNESTVSRNHANITVEENRIVIEDLGSSNGTKVGDLRLSANQPTVAASGMPLRFGNWRVVLEAGGGAGGAEATMMVSPDDRTMVGAPPGDDRTLVGAPLGAILQHCDAGGVCPDCAGRPCRRLAEKTRRPRRGYSALHGNPHYPDAVPATLSS